MCFPCQYITCKILITVRVSNGMHILKQSNSIIKLNFANIRSLVIVNILRKLGSATNSWDPTERMPKRG